MTEATRKEYVNIQVLKPTKQRFLKEFNKAKADKPYYYADQFVNDLLDKLEKTNATS